MTRPCAEHAALLLERGPGEYGFIHLTFEEYLAAVALALKRTGQFSADHSNLSAHVGEQALARGDLADHRLSGYSSAIAQGGGRGG